MSANEGWAGRIVAAIGGLALAYAAWRILAPFVAVLAAAGVVAVAAHPLQARLRGFSKNLAAGMVAACVCLAVALPFSLGGWYLARESLRAYPLVRQAIEGASAPAAEIPPWLPSAARDYLRALNVRDVLLDNIHELGAWSGGVARAAVANAALLAMNALIFVLGLFLLLRDGETALGRLREAIPVAEPVRERIERRAREMIVAVVEGVFAVAVLQGVLSMIGFAILGVRFPVLLGALCMAFSPIPFVGPAIVWAPVAVATALGGQPAKALLLAGWFALVVGTSDNILRPVLIGTRSRLPVAIVVVGVLGGIGAFGPLGAFLGPVIMALAWVVAEVVLEEAGRERS